MPTNNNATKNQEDINQSNLKYIAPKITLTESIILDDNYSLNNSNLLNESIISPIKIDTLSQLNESSISDYNKSNYLLLETLSDKALNEFNKSIFEHSLDATNNIIDKFKKNDSRLSIILNNTNNLSFQELKTLFAPIVNNYIEATQNTFAKKQLNQNQLLKLIKLKNMIRNSGPILLQQIINKVNEVVVSIYKNINKYIDKTIVNLKNMLSNQEKNQVTLNKEGVKYYNSSIDKSNNTQSTVDSEKLNHSQKLNIALNELKEYISKYENLKIKSNITITTDASWQLQ